MEQWTEKYSKFQLYLFKFLVGSSKFHGSEWCCASSLCTEVAFLFQRSGIGSVLALPRLLYWFVSQPSRAKSSDHKLCCGFWSTLSGLRPDHFRDSYWTALGGTEQPLLSGRDWELCVCCSQLPGLPALPADTWSPCLPQDQSECFCAFLKEVEENLGRERLKWERSNWLHAEKTPWLSWFIYSNFPQL